MKATKSSAGRKGISLPKYIIQPTKGGEQAQVSVRIPAALKKEFESARSALQERGMEMQLATVVRLALEEAVAAASKQCAP